MTSDPYPTTPYAYFTHLIREIARDLAPHAAREGLEDRLAQVVVEPPREAAHGDLASNAAMILARAFAQKPRELAEALAKVLRQNSQVQDIAVAGPGFINIRVAPNVWGDVIKIVLGAGDTYGRAVFGKGRKSNVEYVSANPTGPLHVGHVRGAAYGDALANLLQFVGYDVVREYYVNDAGAQIDILARSVFLRYREALGEDIGAIGDGLYPGAYLIDVGQALVRAHGDGLTNRAEKDWLPEVRAFAVAAMMDMIRADLALLNIHHDVFFSESSLHEGQISAIDNIIAQLRADDLVYEGRLPPPKGKPPEDWQERTQTLFRASNFGDDMDRPLVKSSGEYTYFAADMAYFQDKLTRGFDEMIYVLGADHDGYAKRLRGIAKALAGDPKGLVVRFCQLVRLLRGGEPVRMSKRAGDFVTLRAITDEVGADAVRFIMLSRRNDASLDFDFEAVVEQSRDNPVFYVQYAHARCHSVLRTARAENAPMAETQAAVEALNTAKLATAAEHDVLKMLAQYPRLIESAADAHEPHRISHYLIELSGCFHSLWNHGIKEPRLRFINHDDGEMTKARLALVQAVALVISSGLSIIGVSAPKRM